MYNSAVEIEIFYLKAVEEYQWGNAEDRWHRFDEPDISVSDKMTVVRCCIIFAPQSFTALRMPRTESLIFEFKGRFTFGTHGLQIAALG